METRSLKERKQSTTKSGKRKTKRRRRRREKSPEVISKIMMMIILQLGVLFLLHRCLKRVARKGDAQSLNQRKQSIKGLQWAPEGAKK
mgnify:CR=1 FL=1